MRNTMPYASCPLNRQPAPSLCCDNKQVLAMAYVPWQNWQSLYDAKEGFCHGTIFQELNKQFQGKGGC